MSKKISYSGLAPGLPAEREIDSEMLRAVTEIRERLLAELTDQSVPPEEYATPLWEAFKLLDETVEAMVQASVERD